MRIGRRFALRGRIGTEDASCFFRSPETTWAGLSTRAATCGRTIESSSEQVGHTIRYWMLHIIESQREDQRGPRKEASSWPLMVRAGFFEELHAGAVDGVARI